MEYNGRDDTGLRPHDRLCVDLVLPGGSRSVWYVYTPPITGTYNINTVGSDYDTVLSVWTGSWGTLTSRGCDDDGGGNLTSSLNITLYGGTTLLY